MAEAEDPIVEEPVPEEPPVAEEPQEPEEPKKKKPLECPACEAGAPAWMATFADMATLLMAFFVLILSFTEMDNPSINKDISGSMSSAFGLQRQVPTVEPPMGSSMIADAYKTTKTDPGLQAVEETTDEAPDPDAVLEIRDGVSTSKALSDVENVKKTLATELASGKVEIKEEDGKIVISVNENATSTERENVSDSNSDGRIDQSELEIFAKIAESQSFMETELEVEFFSSDSEDQKLRQARKTRELDDKYQMLKADLQSEITQGLAQIEKVGDQIMISLSAANSFRSGFAELQQGFLVTLRTVGNSIVAAGGKVQISGHTDNIPIAFSERFDSNWDLSAARAASVADFFFANNSLDSTNVSVFGYADTKPVADNADAQGRAANRRIEILIDG
jgi:chemotaxis protein MotB